MHEFQASRIVSAPAERVWELVDDFANTYVYHPVVESSTSTNGTQRGLGARRRCVMYDGGAVVEEVTEHDARARRYAVDVIDHGPFPLTHLSVVITVEDTPEGTLLSYAGTMKPKFGPLGWLMAKTMMVPRFNQMMGQLIDGVEAHLETGKVVEKGGKLGQQYAPAPVASAG